MTMTSRNIGNGKEKVSSAANADEASKPRNNAASRSPREEGFLDRPALLPGEHPKEYAAHLNKLIEQLEPFDAIDERLVRDLAHYEWSSVRYRKMLTELIVVNAQEALEHILQRLIGELDNMSVGSEWSIYGNRHQVLARKYIMKEADAVKSVERLLAEAGLTWDSVEAQAMGMRMYEVERIDRMIRTADHHCNSVQRELERRRNERDKAGRRARHVAQQAEQSAQEVPVRKLAA